MANRRFNQFYNTFHKMPVQLDCNFVVDNSNGNGLGIRSLKGGGIEDVFMHTTAAFTGTTHTSITVDGIPGGTSSLVVGMPVQGSGIPVGTKIASIVNSGSITLSAATTTSVTGGSITYQGLGNSGMANPNPAAGNIMVMFQDNYNYYIGGYSGFVAPVSGSPVLVASAGVTAATTYVIVSVGTTTTLGWQSLGLPVGITPAVGVSFVATATTTAAGTGAVEVPATGYSGIDHIEVVGDPNQTIISGIGASPMIVPTPYIMLACLFEKTLTAPANSTVIGMTFLFQNSAITNQGY